MNLVPFMGLFKNVLGLADQFIVDKDKKIEFEFELKKLQLDSMDALVQTKTIPWVDATVKLITAVVQLARPIGSIGVFVYGLFNPEVFVTLYGANETLGTIAAGATFGAAPAWGVSRHKEKVAQANEKKETGAWEH